MKHCEVIVIIKSVLFFKNNFRVRQFFQPITYQCFDMIYRLLLNITSTKPTIETLEKDQKYVQLETLKKCVTHVQR